VIVEHDLSQPLDDAELEELQQILASRGDGDGLLLDGVHGLVSAIIIGPRAVEPEQWLPLIIDDGRPFASVEQAEEAVRLMLRLYNMVVSDLDEFSYEPILGQIETENGDTALSAQGWCEGFTLGVDQCADLWESRMNSDLQLMRLLDPIVKLSADEGLYEHEAGEEATPLSEQEYEDAIDHLGTAVSDVQQYWREHPADDDAFENDTEPSATTPAPRGGRSLH
jgi:uncharacterized protein